MKNGKSRVLQFFLFWGSIILIIQAIVISLITEDWRIYFLLPVFFSSAFILIKLRENSVDDEKILKALKNNGILNVNEKEKTAQENDNKKRDSGIIQFVKFFLVLCSIISFAYYGIATSVLADVLYLTLPVYLPLMFAMINLSCVSRDKKKTLKSLEDNGFIIDGEKESDTGVGDETTADTESTDAGTDSAQFPETSGNNDNT